jgi:TP901-1 family phage major tail protein
MAKQNSTKWKMIVGVVAIDNLSELSFEVNNKLIDVTTKDSGGWEEYLPGLKGASFSGSGIVDFADTGYTPDEIFSALIAGTSLAIECSDAVSTNKEYTFTGYFDKYSIDGGVEDAIKFSFSGKVTGVVTQATI